MKLLLLSNSTNPGEDFLQWAEKDIQKFYEGKVKSALFFPYAAVTISYDEYVGKVKQKFAQFGVDVVSVHEVDNRKKAVENAESYIMGGGNTFRLLKILQQFMLIDLLRYQVNRKGIPYLGWSAGANVVCPTISTTNDMPIVEPDTFTAINLVQFQINPHYTGKTIPGHGGESRDDRIREFLVMDPETAVIGMPEGSLLEINDFDIEYRGKANACLFEHGAETKEIVPGSDLSHLY